MFVPSPGNTDKPFPPVKHSHSSMCLLFLGLDRMTVCEDFSFIYTTLQVHTHTHIYKACNRLL